MCDRRERKIFAAYSIINKLNKNVSEKNLLQCQVAKKAHINDKVCTFKITQCHCAMFNMSCTFSKRTKK